MWTLGLILAMAPAPAMADTKVFDDPVGDSTFVDISRVRVVHRDAVMVRVQSGVRLTAGQLYAFWIDAGHGPQPDYSRILETRAEDPRQKRGGRTHGNLV